MPKMIAMKRFRYPRGGDGKDLKPGDEFEVKTDRDAKALRLMKVARDSFEDKKDQVKPAEGAAAPARRARTSTYSRSDVQAEEDK